MDDRGKSGLIRSISERISKLRSDVEESNKKKAAERMERRRTTLRNIFGVDIIDESGRPRSQEDIERDKEKKLEEDFKSGKESAVVMYDHLIKKIWKELGLNGSPVYKENGVFECELADYKCRYKEAWISHYKFSTVLSRLRDIGCEIIAFGGGPCSPIIVVKIPDVDDD